ncbi:hypothetical protein [Pleurocapsa sp. PCC 7319]|uniref:hypothetical protein n=1 Tax=Pleurocapsa sp. PCC 7319 TaxID=118161 RepID=UPI000349784E|nr:hypothetical protein [Pleurocapsa sp. PCC 7319]
MQPEQTTAQACRSDRVAGQSGGLTIKGQGGVPAEPIEPFIADSILVNGQTGTQNEQTQYLDIKPISTGIGDITPARGVMVTESGEVILTAYPTDNIDTRTPHISANCS